MLNEKNVPFVGRKDEINRLMSKLSPLLFGRGATVIVSGESGLGKTRLLEEFLRLAENTDCQIRSVRNLPGRVAPFSPFISAFIEFENIFRLVEGYGDKYDSSNIYFDFLHVLKKISIGRPLILVIEDVQWADTQSINLIQFLSRNITDQPMLMIISYRPEELDRDLPGSTCSNSKIMNGIIEERLADEIRLVPLHQSSISTIIERSLGGKVEPDLLVRLTDLSSGNPLFLIEIVNYYLSNQTIFFKDDTWKFQSHSENQIPPTVKLMIRKRVAEVSEIQLSIIQAASIFGIVFSSKILSSMLKIDHSRILKELDNVAKDFGIIVGVGEEFRFSHDLLRMITYEGISDISKRNLHFLAAQAIELEPESIWRDGELCSHYFKSGLFEKAMEHGMVAGYRCLKNGAYLESLEYYLLASYKFQFDEKGGVDWQIITEGLADAQKEVGELVDSVTNYQRLLESPLRYAARGRILRKEAECYIPSRLGDVDRLLQLLDEAERCQDIEMMELGEIKSDRALLSLLMGDLENAEQFCKEAELLFMRNDALGRYALELTDHAFIMLSSGKLMQCIELSEKAEKLFIEYPFPIGEREKCARMGDACLSLGFYDRALSNYDRAIEISLMIGDYHQGSYCYLLSSLVYEAIDDLDAMLKKVDGGMENARRSRSKYSLALPLSLEAHVLLLQGEQRIGIKKCYEAVEIMGDYNPSAKSYSRGIAYAVMSEIHVDLGELLKAEDEFNYALDQIKGTALSHYVSTMIRRWYASALMGAHRNDDAKYQLDLAVQELHLLGNDFMAQRIEGQYSHLIKPT